VELLVAVTVGAVVALGARALFEGVAGGAARVAAERADAATTANGLRVLRALAAQVEVGVFPTEPSSGAPRAEERSSTAGGAAGSGPAVTGDDETLRMATWCATPSGWPERCLASLTFIAARTTEVAPAVRDVGQDLVAELAPSAPAPPTHLALVRGLHAPAFRYLASAASGGRWVARWDDPAVPLAVGVVTATDTLILPIGTRQ